MTPLVLSLALTGPAHPPAPLYPPPPPVVRVYAPPAVPVVRPSVIVVTAPAVPLYAPQYTPPVVPVYQPAPVVPVAPAAVTLSDFSRVFAPTPGTHDVWIVHPVTRQPVKVCFTLPGGRLREFEVDRRSIRFEFRDVTVDIEFRHNGTVDVRYRN